METSGVEVANVTQYTSYFGEPHILDGQPNSRYGMFVTTGYVLLALGYFVIAVLLALLFVFTFWGNHMMGGILDKIKEE